MSGGGVVGVASAAVLDTAGPTSGEATASLVVGRKGERPDQLRHSSGDAAEGMYRNAVQQVSQTTSVRVRDGEYGTRDGCGSVCVETVCSVQLSPMPGRRPCLNEGPPGTDCRIVAAICQCGQYPTLYYESRAGGVGDGERGERE